MTWPHGPHVWTVSEIRALPDWNKSGWFYGFARVDGRLRFGEIFPGSGVAITAPQPWWSLRSWWMALCDVFRFCPGVAK